jgi:hypothetical protein
MNETPVTVSLTAIMKKYRPLRDGIIKALRHRAYTEKNAHSAEIDQHITTIESIVQDLLLINMDLVALKAPTIRPKLRNVREEIEILVAEFDRILNPKPCDGRHAYMEMRERFLKERLLETHCEHHKEWPRVTLERSERDIIIDLATSLERAQEINGKLMKMIVARLEV